MKDTFEVTIGQATMKAIVTIGHGGYDEIECGRHPWQGQRDDSENAQN